MPRLTVYTDGACSGNPGPGGWGWVIPDVAWGSGAEADSTNQRMELAAVLNALRSIDEPVEVISDSTYVVNCFRDSWWEGWLKRGWKNSQKKPVANRDLWEPLIGLYRARMAEDPNSLKFTWVKGHSGNEWNDVADALAVRAGRTQQPYHGAGRPDLSEDASTGAGLGSSPTKGGGADPTGRAAPTGHLIAALGHRPPELGGWEPDNPVAAAVTRRLADVLGAKQQLHDDLVVLTGLQLGAEQLAVDAALAADVPFVAVLAFPDPSAVWPKPAQQRFDRYLDQARDVIVLQSKVPETKADIAGAMKRRDAWLARNAAEAVVVWDRQHAAVGAAVRAMEKALGDEVWIVDPSEV